MSGKNTWRHVRKTPAFPKTSLSKASHWRPSVTPRGPRPRKLEPGYWTQASLTCWRGTISTELWAVQLPNRIFDKLHPRSGRAGLANTHTRQLAFATNLTRQCRVTRALTASLGLARFKTL